MNYDVLTPEQKAEAPERRTPEEMLELARDEGFELSDEELEQVSVGASWEEGKIEWRPLSYTCPRCGRDDVWVRLPVLNCNRCGFEFRESGSSI